MHIKKSHQVSEGCHFREAMCAILLLKWGAQAKLWSGHRVSGPKIVLTFCCTLLKSAESNAELKGSDTDSLVIEHIWVNNTSKMQQQISP